MESCLSLLSIKIATYTITLRYFQMVMPPAKGGNNFPKGLIKPELKARLLMIQKLPG